MTDYHTVYKGLPTDTTQWEDIHRRLGNLPPKAPVWKPERYAPEQEEARDTKEWLDKRDEGDLSDAEDDFADNRALEEYRQKRIQELQKAARRPRFGTVEEIRGSEFVQKVTDASKGPAPPLAAQCTGDTPAATGTRPAVGRGDEVEEEAEGRGAAGATRGDEGAAASTSSREGVWVVVQLYKDGHGASALISQCVDELAERYPRTKFVRIISTDCIPKYPDSNLPTLLVYHQGQCLKHLVGLSAFGGRRTTPDQVALVLNQLGPVCSTTDEGDEDEEQMRLVKQLLQRVVVAREEAAGGGLKGGRDAGDESSDFDD